MRLFTYMDFVNEACRTDEIDTVWSPRWSRPDAISGLCDPEQVGEPREPNAPLVDTVPPDKPFIALSREDRRRLTQELSDKLLILAHKDPAAFMDSAGPQINKFLDAAQKLDEKQVELVITDQNIDSISTADLKRHLFSKLPSDIQDELLEKA